MAIVRIPFNAIYTFRAPVIKANSTDLALTADWTPAAGDVKVILDGGAAANITALPTFISGTGILQWTLSAAETNATEIVVQVIDQGTKTIQDQVFIFRTPDYSTLTSAQVATAVTPVVPTAAQIGTEIFDTQTVETGMSFRGAMRLVGAVLAGRRSGTGSGTETFNAAVTNAKARVTASIDGNGNRTNVSTDQT